MHYIAGKGRQENIPATFSPNLASGLFLMRPGFKIDRYFSFFYFNSASTSPLVRIYKNLDLGSEPLEETSR